MFRYLSLFATFLCLIAPTPSYAGGFWYGFQKYWTGFLGEQNGVVMTVLGVGALGVLILTFGGKWKK